MMLGAPMDTALAVRHALLVPEHDTSIPEAATHHQKPIEPTFHYKPYVRH